MEAVMDNLIKLKNDHFLVVGPSMNEDKITLFASSQEGFDTNQKGREEFQW